MYDELVGRTGLSRRKLVLTRQISNNLHLAKIDNEFDNE